MGVKVGEEEAEEGELGYVMADLGRIRSGSQKVRAEGSTSSSLGSMRLLRQKSDRYSREG